MTIFNAGRYLSKVVTKDYRTLVEYLLVGFILRLILIPFFYDAGNLWDFSFAAGLANSGYNPYQIIHSFPQLQYVNPWQYPPTYLIFAMISEGVAAHNELFFLFATKVPLILSDVVSAVFIFKICTQLNQSPQRATKLAVLYFLNPLVIIISAVWGTIDPIPIMLTVVATYYFVRSKGVGKSDIIRSALLLGSAACFKPYVAIVALVLLVNLRTIKSAFQFVSACVIPFALVSFPFLVLNFQSYAYIIYSGIFGASNANQLLSRLFLVPTTYIPTDSTWWLIVSLTSSVLPSWGGTVILVLFLLSILMYLWYIRARQFPILAGVAISFVLLYLLSPRLWGNYFEWYIPFAYLIALNKDLTKWKLMVFQFAWVPEFAFMMLVNGSYGNWGGSAGIFYWTINWLNLQIVPLESVPMQVQQILVLSSFILFGIAFVVVLKSSGRISENTVIEAHKRRDFGVLRRALLLTLIVVLLITISFYPRLSFRSFASSNFGSATVAESSTLVVYDNFTSAILSPIWSNSVGSGSITLHPSQAYITFNTLGIGKQLYVAQVFPNSTGTLTFDVRLDSLYSNSTGVIFARTNYGWIGVSQYPTGYAFTYNDDVSSRNYRLTQSIDTMWHQIEMTFDSNARTIYFDQKIVAQINESSKLSFVQIGQTGLTPTQGGIFDIASFRASAANFSVTILAIDTMIASLVVPIVLVIILFCCSPYLVEILSKGFARINRPFER